MHDYLLNLVSNPPLPIFWGLLTCCCMSSENFTQKIYVRIAVDFVYFAGQIECLHFFDVGCGEVGKYSLTDLAFWMTSVNREIILIVLVTIVFQYTYCLLYHYKSSDTHLSYSRKITERYSCTLKICSGIDLLSCKDR